MFQKNSMTLGALSALLTLAFTGGVARGQSLSLNDRVAPPQTVGVPPLAYVKQPTPRAASAQEQRAQATWPLPIGEVPRIHVASKDEQRQNAWRHPALDIPSVAAADRPALPVETRLPVVAGSYVRGPLPEQPLAEIRTPHDVEATPRLSEDPKAAVTFRYLTNPVATQPPLPVPLLRLTIPDPFATLQASRLPLLDLDRDPPSVPLSRPAPPAAR